MIQGLGRHVDAASHMRVGLEECPLHTGPCCVTSMLKHRSMRYAIHAEPVHAVQDFQHGTEACCQAPGPTWKAAFCCMASGAGSCPVSHLYRSGFSCRSHGIVVNNMWHCCGHCTFVAAAESWNGGSTPNGITVAPVAVAVPTMLRAVTASCMDV